MTFLDPERLAAVDVAAFRGRRPYPWANPIGLLRPEAHRRLRESLPPLELFEPSFGGRRKHGQASHDRHLLRERPDLELPPPWRAFLDELRGPVYRAFLSRLLGTRGFDLLFEWHYTPAGCSVSPHCDARWKLGSHVFYWNDRDDWDPAWGGETLILDDRGRFPRASAPDFDEFDEVIAAESLGNASLLFARRGNSWHGVREIRAPEGALRKVFIVTPRRVLLPGVAGRIVHDWFAARKAAARGVS